jgi:CO/xanthine dehydrogenase Mo-binding subunit
MNNIDRRAFLASSGALVVGFAWAGAAAASAPTPVATPKLDPAKVVDKGRVEAFVAIHGDGRATVYTGKVDLGNGSRTAMAQLAADELDLPFDRITLVMGDTGTTPDQWLPGASLTIAQGGIELRRACATARAALLARGAAKLGLAPEGASCRDGAAFAKADTARRVGYGELAALAPLQLAVDPKVVLKKPADYQWIGKPVPRVDIPAKLSGEWTFVHDFRLPGMLHARVLRPGATGASLLSFDDSAAKKVDGFVRSVRKGDFLAVLAKTEWGAIKAMRAVKARWGGAEPLPDPATVFDHWRSLRLAKEDVTQNVGDARAALAASSNPARKLKARYDFAVQTHASMGPSCAVADFRDGQLTVWSASQATHSLVTEIAPIVGLPAEKVRIVYLEGSGCYGRNGHEDASADAALLAVLGGQRVRVQWMRDDEMARSPKSPPRSIDLEAALDENGDILAWQGDFWIALNHIVAFKPLDFPLLAASETGLPRPGNWVGFLFQNSGVGYTLPNVRVNTRHVERAFFRSAHLRSPGRIENTFANESFIDELAFAAKADPAEYRLRYLKDPRGVAVVHKAMARAKWQPRAGLNPDAGGSGDVARGRGISYLRYSNNNTYVAAVADVAVNRKTGEIKVERVCIAHDCGLVVNPDGTINQIEGGTIQTVSRTLTEAVRWDRREVLSRDWLSYPILRHDQVPRVEVDLIDRPDQPTFAAGEPTPCAIPAAIANAVFDATGARLREIPFTPDKVKAALLHPVGG